MSDERAALSPVKQALLEIRELRERLAAAEGAAGEPIAIVGTSCRLPGGVHDEASLWRVLAEGIDTIGPIPPERWDVAAHHDPDPDRPGTMWTGEGGFLDDVAGFDAAFFGIAPLEAASMDPQQRLMLELAWHALEDAGIAPDSLAGSRTGVFVGVGNSDYARLLWNDTERIDAYAGSGGSLAVVAGRVSYVLGLQGPALSVDTACSSSLVAVHLACQSLRSGECDLALVGGVNLILTPDAHIAFTKARMMARDGRCKTFDAAADGYGRGEGAAVLVLQRQRDAQAADARSLALIRGTAMNQDGRSSGLTAPNGPAQEAVIRAALAQAKLAPADIDLVEAHGTGTSLGDPIELQALAATLGAGREAGRPLLVGSCKTNFGHLEAAAGIVGLLKAITALQHRQVPPHLHFKNPNPLVDWAAMPLRVPTTLEDWPQRGAPARIGISSFGFSGTNAHVILEEVVPQTIAPDTDDRPLHLLALAAHDDEALNALALAWRERLAEPAATADLCFSANTGRAQLPQRLAVRGGTSAELAAALAARLAGATHPALAGARASTPPPKVAFLFTGQGAQYIGMARTLYEHAPVFRETIDHCAAVLDGLLDTPLLELLYSEAHATRLDETAIAQPALFATQVALAALWRSWGIEPAVVLGHSLGEYAAACVAGIFPQDDALRVVARRGRLTQNLPGDGAMASIPAGEARVRETMTTLGLRLDFAAFNGAQQVVVSGARADVETLTRHLDAQGLDTRALRVSHAFHSELIEPALAPLGEALASVRFGSARCTVITNLRGAVTAPGEMAEPGYWLRQMRAPVRFADALQTLLAQRVTHVVEIGPHPVLLGMAAADLPADSAVQWLPSLRRGGSDWAEMFDALQHLFVAGARVDWRGVDRGHARTRMSVPMTPFRHRRHWTNASRTRVAPGADGAHSWERLVSALTWQSAQAPIGVDVTGYAKRWAVLEELTVAHAATVLRNARLFATAGESATVEQVRDRLGANASYRHLLERWLRRLAVRGALRADGERFIAEQPLADPDLDRHRAAARSALAGDPAQLAYIEHCGNLLADVIAGRESPLETLFPGGSPELAEAIYQRSTPMRYVNTLAASAFEALVAARGAAAPLRVLEIGAGTGSTTAALLPVLPAARTRYHYTDVTAAFFDRAMAKFAGFPFLRFETFDLDRDAASQGFAPASFDIVFAANAVHAVRDLRAALATIHSLLAPGGVLVLVESTEHLAWFDMTTGLIEGWQVFDDDLRGDNPLLGVPQWLVALREAGFAEASAWPPQDSEPAAMGQQLIAARVGGSALAIPFDAEMPQHAAAPSAPPADASAETAAALRQRLEQAGPDEQRELLREAVRDAVAAVLRLGPADLPSRNDRLMDLGMDSLMAVQLRNRIGRALGLARPLPATLMFDHPTIEALAVCLQPLLAAAIAPPAPAAATPVPPVVASLGAERVAAMSDAEIEALLMERLNKQ